MSNPNAGYTVQPPAVAFSATLHSLKSNMLFYQQRGELRDDAIAELALAAELIQLALLMIRDRDVLG